MKAFTKALFGLFGLLLLVASPALAQTWTLVHSTTVSGGPVSSGAAGSTLQDGYVDTYGSTWQVSSANYFDVIASRSPSALAGLLRPSSEDTVDTKIVALFQDHASGGSSLFLAGRHNRSTSSSAVTAYLAGVLTSNGTLNIYKVVSGTTTSLVASSALGLTNLTNYYLTVTIVQTNGTTTTITATVTTTGGTTVGSPLTITDTTTALQNLSGSSGMVAAKGSSVDDDVSTISTYTDISGPASSYTLSGPASGTVSTASTNFSVTSNGTASSGIVVTPADGGKGGTFTPSTVTFPSGAASTQTFTYTPAVTGTITISTTNSGGLTNPASLSYTSAASTAATSYTNSGPSSGANNTASGAFNLTPNGTLAGSTVFTPAVSGCTATFSPTTVTITPGQSYGSYTITPSTTGTCSITVTNNGGLTNPSAVSYASTAASIALPTVAPPVSTSGGTTLVGTAATGGSSPYTYQWYQSTAPATLGTAISGATSLSVGVTGLTNGTAYYFTLVATDSASNTATSNQVAAVPGVTRYILEIGDSYDTTSVASGTTTQVVGNSNTPAIGNITQQKLEAMYGDGTHIVVLNKGVGGTNTYQWGSGSGNLTSALSAMNSAHTPASDWTVHVHLAGNDSSNSGSNDSGHGETAAEYSTGMSGVISALTAAGVGHIVLEGAPYLAPLSANHTNAGVLLLSQYNGVLQTLAAANPAYITADTREYYYNIGHQSEIGGDNVHPQPADANGQGGATSRSVLWATAIQPVLTPPPFYVGYR